MRSASASHYWKKVYTQKYSSYLHSLTLSDCLGFTGKITFSKGITAFCGLNGVGKSTLVDSIKHVLGLNDNSIITNNKSQGLLEAEVYIDDELITVANGKTAVEAGFDPSRLVYIDSSQSIDLLKYWSEQTNLDEYFEQYEYSTFSENQLNELSSIVGRNYTRCKIIEVDDGDNDWTFRRLYFKVETSEASYESTGMGLGEHLLFYTYYLLSVSEKNSIIILEEPESYISVLSQRRLMDSLAMLIAEKRCSVIITTHSPFILKEINNSNIRIVSNVYGNMIIHLPTKEIEADLHLGLDDILVQNKVATIFVEDYVARLFLCVILKEEIPDLLDMIDIISVDGESTITSILNNQYFKYMTHKFIGIYDGDMRNNDTIRKIENSYFFLPVQTSVENEIMQFLINRDNAELMINQLNVCQSFFYTVYSKHSGEDLHDWFLNICKELKIDKVDFLNSFYIAWKNYNDGIINEFVDSIYNCLSE